MPITIYIPLHLRVFTAGLDRVEVADSAITVSAALEALWALYPGTRDRVMTEQAEIRPHVNVFAGTESIRYTGGRATSVRDGSEISIIPAVSGRGAGFFEGLPIGPSPKTRKQQALKESSAALFA